MTQYARFRKAKVLQEKKIQVHSIQGQAEEGYTGVTVGKDVFKLFFFEETTNPARRNSLPL